MMFTQKNFSTLYIFRKIFTLKMSFVHKLKVYLVVLYITLFLYSVFITLCQLTQSTIIHLVILNMQRS